MTAPDNLFVRETASAGPLVVLVHGSMDRSASFARLTNRLADYKVASYDRRGYNRSRGAPVLEGDITTHVDDLLRVMEGRPGTVFGHSYGGDIALAAAASRPESVQAVVAFEPPVPWLPGWPARSPGGRASATADSAAAAEAFMRAMVGDARWERLPERTREARRAEGVALVAEMASLRAGTPAFDAAALQMPVVIASGSLSDERHRAGSQTLASQISQARLVVIPGAGHAAHLTHPEAIAAIIREVAGAARDRGRGRGAGRAAPGSSP